MRPIILIGMKSSGKSSVGRALAARLHAPFLDLDTLLEQCHGLPTRDLFRQYGAEAFRMLESQMLEQVGAEWQGSAFVLSTGGGTPLSEANGQRLRALGDVVFLDTAEEVLLERILSGGIPPFFPYPEEPARSLAALLRERRPHYQALATLTLACTTESPEALAGQIERLLDERSE